MNSLVSWNADQLIFIDESATNECTENRKFRWTLRGITPHESRLFKYLKHWSILLTYTVDGFITWEVLHDSFTMELFEEFIEFKLLPRCNPYPAERSIIIIDNAPIHISEVYTMSCWLF